MDLGIDFLKSQVNNAVMQHKTFLENLEDHEGQAEDPRFRDLCARFIPTMRQQQGRFEKYQQQLGAELGAGKKALGKALGVARDLADAARESDFLRLVGDIVDAYEKWQVVQDNTDQHGRQTGPGARRGEQRRGR